MMAGTARAKVGPNICLVDQHPAEHDCRRVTVDFRVNLQVGTQTFAMEAVEMCGAGITLAGRVPVNKGDAVQLCIAFPGPGNHVLAQAKVTHVNNGHIGCEYWVADIYQRQFLGEVVQACARREALRKAASCNHI